MPKAVLVTKSDYEEFESSSVQNRRLLRQEELILEVTEALCEMMQKEGITWKQLAGRIGKSELAVRQCLEGGRNLTLRTAATVADGLGYRLRMSCEKVETKKGKA